MENPWHELPEEAPYVLPGDEGSIAVHNSKYVDTVYEIRLDEIPSPYIGNPNVRLVLLNLNPGYSEEESDSLNIDKYRKIARNNLTHTLHKYPFYVLDPSLQGTPSGYVWFQQKLKPLILATGLTDKDFSVRLFLAEYFPYRSVKYKWNGRFLPSQKYTFDLVENAMERDAVIIGMRSKKIWLEAIPALGEYENFYTLKNPQNVVVSQNNLDLEGFSKAVHAIRDFNVYEGAIRE